MQQRNKKSKRRQTSKNVSSSRAPAAKGSKFKSGRPQVRTSNKSTRIQHTELIDTIAGSTSFSVFNSYELNPGLSATFPWLSTQADSWEQYRFHRLEACYISRTSTSEKGSIIFAPEYDSLDSAPATEKDAMSYEGAQDDNVWNCFSTHFNVKDMFPLGPRKYIRSSGAIPGDLKTYDAGVLHVCTNGEDSTDDIGKLYFRYDVEFFIPQTGPSMGPRNSRLSLFNVPGAFSLTSGVNATLTFTEEVENPLGIVNNSGVFTLPAGKWLITAECHVDGFAASSELTVLVNILTDGSVTNPGFNSGSSITGSSLGGEVAVVVSGIVTSDGTTTVALRVNATGSGTLVADADQNRILMMIL